MKLRYLSVLLMFFLLVQHSTEQGFNFSPIASNPTDGEAPPANDAPLARPFESVSGGIVDTLRNTLPTIRNTTNNLLQRLEAPRDRVIQFIRPAVRSEFSRNLTQFLNAIWSRLQDSSISQYPLVRAAIVRPINATLERISVISAGEHDETEEVHVINLDRPTAEDEERLTDYVASSATEHLTATPAVLILDNERDDKHDDVLSDELKSDQPVVQPAAEPAGEQQPAEEARSTETTGTALPTATEHPTEPESPAKSNRVARFMESYYITPQRVRNVFDTVRRSGMQECLALAVCEAHCRPHLYESYGSRGTLFNTLASQVERFQDLSDPDAIYYLAARRYGQQFYDGSLRNGCAMCHARYYCPHEREYFLNLFYRMNEFN